MMNNNYNRILCLILAILLLGCSEETLDDSATGTITGLVVREGNNVPVDNVRISTNPTTSTVFTSANGTFVIENVPVGDYAVQAQKDSLVTQFESATVLANSEVNVIFEMRHESFLNEAPIAPELISPEDDETELNPTVDFIWASSETDEDPVSYTLKVFNGQNNETLLFEDIVDTTYTVNQLNYGTQYLWQVGASDGTAPIVWSETTSFETKPFPETRILFTRMVNGNNVIFAMDEEGTEFPITSQDKNSYRPRKNNATNKIAFLRTVGGQTQIFTMNPDGSNVFQVTNFIPVAGFNMDVVDFSWTNDGNTLVYPNFDKLYKVNATGGGTTLLYETPDGRFISEVDVSEDGSKMAIAENNSLGYNASIRILDGQANFLETVLEGLPGALGGLDFTVNGQQLLYTRDVSGFENFNYRQLDSHMFIYDFNDQSHDDISQNKPDGTNDLDPRFSPNEAEVIFVNTSNDGISQKNLLKSGLENLENTRDEVKEDAKMPDWE